MSGVFLKILKNLEAFTMEGTLSRSRTIPNVQLLQKVLGPFRLLIYILSLTLPILNQVTYLDTGISIIFYWCILLTGNKNRQRNILYQMLILFIQTGSLLLIQISSVETLNRIRRNPYMYVCMYVCVYVCMCVCVNVCMCMYVYVCMYV